MHNALTRIQTTFGFFTTCAFTLASVIAFLSVVPFPSPSSPPKASISVSNVQVVKGRPHYYSPKREEYAQIRFDLHADLSSLFTWNTKQVFVYVTANYHNEKETNEAISEAVIWDTIIPSTSTPYSWLNLKKLYYSTKPKTQKSKTRRSSVDKGKASTTDLIKPGVLSLKNQKPKYQITDPSGVISEKTNATLQVSWNIQPWVGALIWDKGYLGDRVGRWKAGMVGKSETFDFPPLKGTRTDVVKDREGPKTPQAGSATPVVEV